jgi:hypothetical protein
MNIDLIIILGLVTGTRGSGEGAAVEDDIRSKRLNIPVDDKSRNITKVC